jgi:hypothetical protein
MTLDSEDQREKLVLVINSVKIEGTLAEVDHISAGMHQLLNSVRGAEVVNAVQSKEGEGGL